MFKWVKGPDVFPVGISQDRHGSLFASLYVIVLPRRERAEILNNGLEQMFRPRIPLRMRVERGRSDAEKGEARQNGGHRAFRGLRSRTEPGKTVDVNGVTICGPVNMASDMATVASLFYSRSITNLLTHLQVEGRVQFDFGDQITDGVTITMTVRYGTHRRRHC